MSKASIMIKKIITRNQELILPKEPQVITLPFNFEPRPYQLAFYKAVDSGLYDRYFLRWCRRSGKDKNCIALVPKILTERVGNGYYLYPSYAQGRKALWEGKDKNGFPFIDHIPAGLRKGKDSDPDHGKNNNEMKIEFKNGSTFRVMGTDTIDSLVGTNPILIIFSEYALQDPTVWEFLEPILEENDGIAIFNGTPRGQNHMYKMEVDHKGQKGWYFSEVQTLWPDKPNYYEIMSPEKIERVSQKKDQGFIEQEYGVSYVAGAQGRYYAEQLSLATTQGRIGEYPYNPNLWVDVILDLGYRDDTVMGFIQPDGRRFNWIDHYKNNTKEIAHYVRVIKDKGYNIRYIVLPHDSEGGKFQMGLSHKEVFINLLANAGIQAEVIIAPKVHQNQEKIQQVRNVFHTYTFNLETTKDLVAEVGLYHRKWNKAKGMFDDNPDHDINSHTADMVAYEALTREERDTSGMIQDPEYITNFNPLDDNYDY